MHYTLSILALLTLLGIALAGWRSACVRLRAARAESLEWQRANAQWQAHNAAAAKAHAWREMRFHVAGRAGPEIRWVSPPHKGTPLCLTHAQVMSAKIEFSHLRYFPHAYSDTP